MNLLHVTPYYAPAWAYGGVVRAVTDITRALAAAGHTVIVLTTDTLDRSRRTPISEETLDGVIVIRVRNQNNVLRGRFNLSTPIGFGRIARQLIQDHAIDLVHCHELRTVENLCIRWGTGSLDLPRVLSPHGTLSYQFGRRASKLAWDRIFAGYLLPCFDHVIALTEFEAQEVRALWTGQGVLLREDQVAVIPNGIFLESLAQLPSRDVFRRQWQLGSGPIVIYLGRMAKRKGLQFLIPAFADAAKDIPDARLLVVGPDEDMFSRLNVQIKQHGLTPRVLFTGLLSGTDRLAALAASDIFVLPAVGEGFSMAVLEAMACGLPVLLSRDCHFPEVAEAGAGLVVPREQGALSQALQMLMLDAKQRIYMGERARELVRTRYLWPQIVAQLESVYQAAASTHRNRELQ